MLEDNASAVRLQSRPANSLSLTSESYEPRMETGAQNALAQYLVQERLIVDVSYHLIRLECSDSNYTSQYLYGTL